MIKENYIEMVSAGYLAAQGASDANEQGILKVYLMIVFGTPVVFFGGLILLDEFNRSGIKYRIMDWWYK